MFTLLRRISIPEYRKHLLRNLLTMMGIILGVAIFAAIRSANSSLRTSLRDTIDQVAGKAVLQMTAGQAGLPESVVDDIRSVPGVRTAVPVIEAVVHTADVSQGNILILGVDMAGDRSMRDYTMEGNEDVVSDPLVFLAQPDSIIVSKEFAARNNLQEDSRINLVTALGTKTFTVRGIMAPKGMAKAFGGNVGVMDIYSAQFIFSRGRTFDRVDIALDEGVRIDDAVFRIQAKLGPGFKVEPPLRRGKQTESLMEAYSRALFLSSAIALTIGLFLIFNAFSVTVTQRRVQIGILRVLGVTRLQIQLLFLGESLVLGVVGSLIGVVFGILMGRGMMAIMAHIVEQTYGVQVHIDRLHVDKFWTLVSFLMGVAASLAGAYLPARAAGRVDPALALQKGKYQLLFLGGNRVRRLVGLLLLLASMGLGFTQWANTLQVQLVIFALLFISLALLVPTFSHLLAGLLRWPMGRLFGMEGRLASDSLVQAPRRTSATVAALMFSLAFVLIMATFSVSVKASLAKWIEFSINPDLFVSASESLTARTFQFPASVGDELKKVPGVRQVDYVRILTLEYNGRSPLLVSIEVDQWLRRSTPLMEEGRVGDLLPGMLGKNGVLISNNFARIHNLKKGRRIFLDTPTGRHEFEVVGVSVDYTSDSGSLLIDREVYKHLWKDDRVDTFDLMLEKGYDPDAVKTEIQRRLANSRNAFILTNKDMRSEITRLTDQFLNLQYVQILVAVLVAVLGIINSLMVSITERKREIGILRGLGGEKRQVRRAIVLEAVCIGIVAVTLGIVSGAIMGYYSVGTFGAAFNGWIFPYRFPGGMALALVPGVIVISLLAAWYPSSLALKTPLIEALAYE
jgi:putative ABC transport system permease protein